MSDTPSYQPRCRHLCCKSMMVFGEAFESDPEFQGGQTEFWCTNTMTSFGPDQGEVNLELCRNAERGCYQEY